MIAFADRTARGKQPPHRDPHNLTLETFVADLAAEPGASKSAARSRHGAAGHLSRFLGRPATVADLAEQTFLRDLLKHLERGALAKETRVRVRADLLQLGRLAAARGLLEFDRGEPIVDVVHDRVRVPKVGPWSIGELNRILASARTMPDDVAGLPAGDWFNALCLLLLDTGISVAEALAVTHADYDRAAGQLAAGVGVFQLHPLTIAALQRLPSRAEIPDPRATTLLPWPLDGGEPPFHMLLRAFRRLLFRANLPHTTQNLFRRLQITAAAVPDVLDQVDVQFPFEPRAERLALPRAKTRRNARRAAAGEHPEPPLRVFPSREGSGADQPQGAPKRAPPSREADLVLIAPADPARSLLAFFENVYRPRRLTCAADSTISDYRSAIRQFSFTLGCQATLDHLTEDHIERFMHSIVASGKTAERANSRRGTMLALGRLAWKKRLIAEDLRDVEKLPVAKRVPEAWTMEEFSRLLCTAAAQLGNAAGLPAGTFWPALLLVVFDTGLRISAALSLRSADFKPPFILARAENQKQKADQALTLHPDTIELLRSTRPFDRELLLPRGGAYNWYGHGLRRILKQAGLPHGPRDLWHKIRRTHATHLANAVGRAAAVEQLGHSDPSVTARYLDPRLIDRVHAANVLPRPTWRADA